jgi:hypothetical protein
MYGASAVRRLVLTAISTALISAPAGKPADAMQNPSHPDPIGNGNGNRNIFSADSPTSNHGYQHTNNSNAGGLNNVLNALCRRARTCKVTQNLIIKVEQPERSRSEQVTPPRQVVTHARPASPFLYMGPGGFMLMGTDFP